MGRAEGCCRRWSCRSWSGTKPDLPKWAPAYGNPLISPQLLSPNFCWASEFCPGDRAPRPTLSDGALRTPGTMCSERDPRHDEGFAFSLVLDIVNPSPSHFPAGLEELDGTGILISRGGLVVSLLHLLFRHSHAEGHRLSPSKHGPSHCPHEWQNRQCSSRNGAGFLQLSERTGRTEGILGDLPGDQSWDGQWPSSGRCCWEQTLQWQGLAVPRIGRKGMGARGWEGAVG